MRTPLKFALKRGSMKLRTLEARGAPPVGLAGTATGPCVAADEAAARCTVAGAAAATMTGCTKGAEAAVDTSKVADTIKTQEAGWQKAYADDAATIHVRAHGVEERCTLSGTRHASRLDNDSFEESISL